jgi:phenylacetate-CoA ligase
MRKDTMDEVEVKVELDNNLYQEILPASLDLENVIQNDRLSQLYHSFQKKIKDNIGLTMNVDFIVPGNIPRSEGGKLSRIVDLRKK